MSKCLLTTVFQGEKKGFDVEMHAEGWSKKTHRGVVVCCVYDTLVETKRTTKNKKSMSRN